MRDLLSGVITGPICTPSSSPLPTRSRGGRVCDRVAEGLLRIAHRDRDRNGQAALARAAEGAVADDLRRHLHVGIRQDDDVVLRAALALHAFAVAPARA